MPNELTPGLRARAEVEERQFKEQLATCITFIYKAADEVRGGSRKGNDRGSFPATRWYTG